MDKNNQESTETDVKKAAEDSSSDAPESKKDSIEDLDESALEELSESKTIPYQRFKEVNDDRKSLVDQIESLKSRQQSEVQRAIEDAEARLLAKFQREQQEKEFENEDPWDRSARQMSSEVQNLKAELDHLRKQSELQNLKSELKNLQDKYPKADVDAVLGWRQANPGLSLEDGMERSHRKSIESAETILKEMLQKKRDKAKVSVPTRTGGPRLKPEEKPKTLKDAKQAALRWLEQTKG